MSHHSGLDMVTGGGGGARAHRGPGGRRRAVRRGPSRGQRLLRTLILLLFVGGLVYGFLAVRDFLAGPDDYSGNGTGKVVVEVPSGANGQQIADLLAEKDVVKSPEAFYQLSLKDARAQAIQPGFYQLRKKMSALSALDALVDRKNRVEGRITIPEGARIDQIIPLIAKGSEIPEKDVTAALKKPESLGLPRAAQGNPEGYLFPATYIAEPGSSATDLLRQMVAKAKEVFTSLDIAARSRQLGYSGREILTVASLLEREAQRDEDFPKVARVLYNRLDENMPLQLDSTVQYISKRHGDVFTTPEERENPSKYNTYKNTGLPPGPIGSPGEKTIEAALNPATGDWLFFVPDYEAKTTRFSTTLEEHNKWVAKLREYCRTSEDC